MEREKPPGEPTVDTLELLGRHTVQLQGTLICTCGVTMLVTVNGVWCQNHRCPHYQTGYDLPTLTLTAKPKGE